LTDSVSGYSYDNKINCCAVITGEYLETYESQNARLLYIKADGFLKNRKNAEALRCLQEEPKLLTSVCGGFIQFLLRKVEESSFPDLIKATLKELRARETLYKEINNAERLHENRCMLDMAAWLAEMYFLDMGLEKSFISNFQNAAANSIEEIMETTCCLLGGGRMVLRKVMERIFSNAKVRKAKYRKNQSGYHFGNKLVGVYEQVYFCIDREDDFLYIEDYKKSLQKDNLDQYQEEQEVLLIGKERLTDLFHNEMQELLKETGTFSSKLAGNIEKQLLRLLREEQLIYQVYRNDSGMGRPTIEYPVYVQVTYHDEFDEENETRVYIVNFENVVQINMAHPYVEYLYKRVQEAETEMEVIPERYEVEGRNGNSMTEIEIYEKRRKFIRGKSLYRK
jgi:hypothetical protein